MNEEIIIFRTERTRVPVWRRRIDRSKNNKEYLYMENSTTTLVKWITFIEFNFDEYHGAKSRP